MNIESSLIIIKKSLKLKTIVILILKITMGLLKVMIHTILIVQFLTMPALSNIKLEIITTFKLLILNAYMLNPNRTHNSQL